MKHIKTFEQFINEESHVNEANGSSYDFSKFKKLYKQLEKEAAKIKEWASTVDAREVDSEYGKKFNSSFNQARIAKSDLLDRSNPEKFVESLKWTLYSLYILTGEGEKHPRGGLMAPKGWSK